MTSINSSFIEGLITIVMPVYNRGQFIPDAIESINKQSYLNWELIIVDDGSSDNSLALCYEYTKHITQNVIIHSQKNQGPAGARNAGIMLGKGEYFAFFDSDDYWYPYHLKACISEFSSNPTLDWVYAACRRINYATDVIEQDSTFYTDGNPNLLFSVASVTNNIHILDNAKAVFVQLKDGIDCGLQNSVVRRNILLHALIPTFRVGEDRLYILMMLKAGFNFGFIDEIHVDYRIHENNISDTNKASDNMPKRIDSLKQLITAKKAFPEYLTFITEERAAYKKQLANEIFWELGYSLQMQSGDYRGALSSYFDACRYNPWNVNYYKSILTCFIKYIIHQRIKA